MDLIIKKGNVSMAKHKLRVMMLGGLNEIGKNLAVLEYGDDMIIVDCGIAFPDEDMLGIDLVGSTNPMINAAA